MVCITPNLQPEIWHYTEKLFPPHTKKRELSASMKLQWLRNTFPIPQHKYFSSLQKAERALKTELGFRASAESEGARSTQQLCSSD